LADLAPHSPRAVSASIHFTKGIAWLEQASLGHKAGKSQRHSILKFTQSQPHVRDQRTASPRMYAHLAWLRMNMCEVQNELKREIFSRLYGEMFGHP